MFIEEPRHGFAVRQLLACISAQRQLAARLSVLQHNYEYSAFQNLLFLNFVASLISYYGAPPILIGLDVLKLLFFYFAVAVLLVISTVP